MTPALGSVSERGIAGSQTSIATLTGSTHNILDTGKMISLQEDARSRNISTEVIKRSLYKNVTAPCRRRMNNRMSVCNSSMRYDNSMNNSHAGSNFNPRMFQSLPVTPAQSLAVTPAHSPTSNKSFFYGFLSRGATPRCTSPVPFDEEELAEEAENFSEQGLASIFRPHPRYISASGDAQLLYGRLDLNEGTEIEASRRSNIESSFTTIMAPPKVPHFRNKSSMKRNDVVMNHSNVV